MVAVRLFQSTPTITGRRIGLLQQLSLLVAHCFNPRPPLLVGESSVPAQQGRLVPCFNPRPPLLVGESGGRDLMPVLISVSIHAHHYW